MRNNISQHAYMSRCTVEGVVKEAHNGVISVEIPSASECSSCSGRIFCGTGDGKRVKIHTEERFAVGEMVTISTQRSSLMMTAFMLYAIGAFVAVILAAVAAVLHSEMAAVAVFFAAVTVWIPMVAKLLGRISSLRVSKA